jgi:hypothetical protein
MRDWLLRVRGWTTALWEASWRHRLIWPLIAVGSLSVAVTALAYGAVLAAQHSIASYLIVVFANVVVDLGAIGAAVLVIDQLHRRRTEYQEQRTLVELLGSQRPDVADEALRKLRARGWLANGVLRNAYLRGANLENAQLAGADLAGADLQDANLSWANLQHVNLVEANLQRTRLERSDLRGADLERANMQGASLWRANLRRARLAGANLDGANLSETTMPDGTVHS